MASALDDLHELRTRVLRFTHHCTLDAAVSAMELLCQKELALLTDNPAAAAALLAGGLAAADLVSLSSYVLVQSTRALRRTAHTQFLHIPPDSGSAAALTMRADAMVAAFHQHFSGQSQLAMNLGKLMYHLGRFGCALPLLLQGSTTKGRLSWADDVGCIGLCLFRMQRPADAWPWLCLAATSLLTTTDCKVAVRVCQAIMAGHAVVMPTVSGTPNDSALRIRKRTNKVGEIDGANGAATEAAALGV